MENENEQSRGMKGTSKNIIYANTPETEGQ